MKIRIDGAEFKKIMSICSKCIDNTGVRELLKYVCLRVWDDDGGQRYEATGMDGFRMAMHYGHCLVEENPEGEKFHEFLLPVLKVPKVPVVTVEDNEEEVTITWFCGTVVKQTFAKPKAQYLDIDKILAKTSEESSFAVSVNTRMLAEVLAGLGTDERQVTLRFFGPLNGIAIEGECNRGFVLPVRDANMAQKESVWQKRVQMHR